MAWMSLKFISDARRRRTSKNGEGPTLIECDTYRKYGHFEGDEQKVKSPNDRNADKNATEDFKRQALEEGWLTEEELNGIERR